MTVYHTVFGAALVAATMLSAPSLAAPNLAARAAPLTVGSDNVAVIEPPVAHPAEKPCVVKLYDGATFGANNVNFNYKPPASCAGPWATVVLSVDVSLDKGIQYDRTGTIWLAGVPLWFGTTAEPTPKLAPSWHFERDVTDYTSLLTHKQTGFVLIANYTTATDTSIITSSAKLLFYPATTQAPAPRVPDMVIPLAAPGGGTVALNTGTDTVSINQRLPTNIEAAALDVYLQGQSGDEFWYTCVPDALSSELESCGGGSFREGEISIDGTPAGVAPVYPWIFTGGIDPYLWSPIPGVQTLSFKPFRAELSPFTGVLSNGASHNIALSVYGANNYYSVAGALMLYLDSGSTQVTGSVTQNTLAGTPSPVVTNTIHNTANGIAGGVNTSAIHNFTITGSAVTSHGTVQYGVNQIGDFANDQKFVITSSLYQQLISQATNTTVETTATTANGTNTRVTALSYPLTVDITEHVLKSGNISQATTINQVYDANVAAIDHGTENAVTVQNGITTADTLIFSPSFQLVSHKNQSSAASYGISGSTVTCFGRTLTAANNVLTSVKTGCPK
jgi:hypothetical protein